MPLTVLRQSPSFLTADTLLPSTSPGQAAATTSTALVPGCLGYWGFDEGAGSVVYDLSGRGNHGLWQGTLGSQWGTGIVNGGGVFNGTNNWVKIIALTTTGFTNTAWQPFSLSMWLNAPVVPASNQRTFTYEAGGTGVFGIVYASTGTIIAETNNGGTNPQKTSSVTFAYATWHHVVATSDGAGTVALYVDNTNVTHTASGGVINGTANWISIGSQVGASFFSGQIDEVGIWPRVLSVTEVSLLWNSGAGARPF